MSRRRRIVLSVIAALIAAIAFFPLSFAVRLAGLEEQGITASAARGTIWRGRLEDVAIGAIAVGDVRVRVAPLATLTGKLRLHLEGEGADAIRGSVFSGISGFGGDGLNGTLPVTTGFPLLPSGRLNLTDVRFAFSGMRCDSAEGQARLNLDSLVPGLPIGRTLVGPIKCMGGGSGADAVGATMIGASAMERLSVSLRPDGRYSAMLIISASDPEMAAKLRQLGLRETQAGFMLSFDGRF